MEKETRSRLVRFALILLAVLVFAVGGFVGLGWMVRHQFVTNADYGRWVNRITQNDDLWKWYGRTCAGLLPGDADGDGASDGLELFCGTGPKNSSDQWMMNFVPDGYTDSHLYAYSGERRRLRLRADTAGIGPLPWPEEFRCSVTANESMLLLPGGAREPTAGPILFTASAGFVEVDILPQYYERWRYIRFEYPVTHQGIANLPISTVGWRMPPIPVSFGGGAPKALEAVSGPKIGNDDARRTLTWYAPAPLPDGYAIEVARADGDSEWVVASSTEPPVKDWAFANQVWDRFPGYAGPLKFRVIPVRHTPP